MLKSRELDERGFDEIVEVAVEEISKRYPGWTNYNKSDPGITIVELFAFMTEVLEYRLNIISDEHLKRYLKLLGKEIIHRTSAYTYLKMTGTGFVKKDTCVYAGDIPFETECDFEVWDNEIASLICEGELIKNNNGFGDISLYPFGKTTSSNSFIVNLKNKPAKNTILSFYLDINSKDYTKIKDGYKQFIYLNTTGTTKIIKDETYGFMSSGMIWIKINEDIKEEDNGYPITFLLERGSYPKSPILNGIEINVVKAIQKKTLVKMNEMSLGEKYEIPREAIYLGYATGLSNYELEFEFADCIEKSLVIYVREEDEIFQYEYREDFDSSDKYDRHFIYDREQNVIRFGDGYKGLPPVGDIYLVSCVVSYEERGNINRNSIDYILEDKNIHVKNITPGVGGMKEESLEKIFEISNEEEINRCVTLEDYENCVKNTPAVFINRIKAFKDRRKENTVFIALEIEKFKKDIPGNVLYNLKKYVDEKKLIGTNVIFLPPSYLRINIYLKIVAEPYSGDVKEVTKEAIKNIFDEKIGFGQTIRAYDIIRILNTYSFINNVENFEMMSMGDGGVTLPNGDISLGMVNLPMVDKITIHVV